MKKRSIYPNQSQELLQLFEEAGNSKRVLCVPIDYAKVDHVALFCDGNGDLLRKPFTVRNSPEGVTYLTDHVTRWCGHHGIKTKHVFFGGEDVGPYAENFVSTLRSGGWLVAGVNAGDAKKQRSNLQASTDRLDLMGIARMLITRRGNCSPAQKGAYRNLRNMTRHRRKLVFMTTEVSNRTHGIVDRLFPGFLDEKKSGIASFSKSSLWLMEHRFGAPQIRRRKRSALIETLRRYGTPKPEDAATKLQAYAATVLTTPDEYVGTLQMSLAHQVKHYHCLQEAIEDAEKEMAVWLSRTPGAFLTTVRGIGIVLAAGVAAEIGDPEAQKPVGNLCSYAGIVPRVSQSGGPEGDTHTGSVAKRCNRILKDYVVQSGQHLGLHGPDDLLADYGRREAAGQHAAFGLARRYIRIGMRLTRMSQVYLPPHLRKKGVPMKERAGYYLTMWPYLRNKWQKAGALKAAFEKDRPLGEWRNMIQELYGITLKL